MAAITLVSSAPNSSSFTLSGEASASVSATCAPILPISVAPPVLATTARAAP